MCQSYISTNSSLKTVFFISYSLWFSIFWVNIFFGWFDQLSWFLSFKISSDLFGGICGDSLFFVSGSWSLDEVWGTWTLSFIVLVLGTECWYIVAMTSSPVSEVLVVLLSLGSSSGWAGSLSKVLSTWALSIVCLVLGIECWYVVTMTRSPIFNVLVIFLDLWISGSWALSLSKVWGTWALSFIVLVLCTECWNIVAMSSSPVSKVLVVLLSFWSSSGWAGWSLLGTNFSFSLNKLAILESTLNKMEEVSDERSFLCFINTFKKFRVHFLLEEFIHINFKISLKKSLLSKSNFMHVGVHAHRLNFRLHLRMTL